MGAKLRVTGLLAVGALAGALTTMQLQANARNSLAPLPLEELQQMAGLLTRMDRKYVVPAERVDGLLASIGPYARVLEISGLRSFGYRSVYFDTRELASYLGAARRRRRRFKVRTRTYLDSGGCWLEVKTRGARGATVKDRLPYSSEYQQHVEPGRWFVDQVLGSAGIESPEDFRFEPALVSQYRRTTFLLPDSASRVTVDTELSWVDGAGQRLLMPGLVVVETKTGSTPSYVDRLLWSRGHRPTRISKYATALAALYPELPATPWHRTLNRCFVAGRS